MLTVICLVNSETFICIDLPLSTLILSVISSSDAALLVLHDWTRSKNSDERYSSYRKKRVYGKGILNFVIPLNYSPINCILLSWWQPSGDRFRDVGECNE